MIYPTRLAILATAAGAPVALTVATVSPAVWYAGLAWPAAVIALTLADALAGPGPGRAQARLSLPSSAFVGEESQATVRVRIGGRAPRRAEVALASDPLLAAQNDGRVLIGLAGGDGSGRLPFTATRRGTARIGTLWLRWRGTFGLVWKQRRLAVEATLPILPDIRPIRDRGAKLLERHALDGMVTQPGRGEGSEFETLVEYRPGMDRRAIDWKQSARHLKLHAKEYQPERNAMIVLAIDAGRQMSEPVDGLPRVDRAVTAALFTAWIGLKLGDRVALHAFDARPRLSSGAVSGPTAFAALQRLAAGIDYSTAESNHTLALSTLAGQLNRRSLVVLFTEFADEVSADFLVRAAARLVTRHLLMVVVLTDSELEGAVAAAPATADDVARAVTAAALLKQRQLVLARLQALGVHLVESPHAEVTDRLVAAYLDIKRRGLL